MAVFGRSVSITTTAPHHRCWVLQVPRGSPALLTLCSLPGPVEAPGQAAVLRALSSRLLALAADPERDPDPSVYLALRLAGEHDLRREQQYLERLQDAFQHRYGR